MRASPIRHGRRKGATVVETALWAPILILLLMGTLEVARFAYTYYILQKVLFSTAQYLSSLQGTDFCNPSDPNVLAAEYFGLTGTADNSAPSVFAAVTPDMMTVTIENADPTTGALSPCNCGVPGCDTNNGGLAPSYIVVSLTNGYSVTPNIPLVAKNPIILFPQVRVPYGGT
jgi:Flp pilus assembly protein TadG